MLLCKARNVGEQRKYLSPELTVFVVNKADVLTLSGNAAEGVGIKWNWNFDNPFGNQEEE
ncbi:MAG: hypothetical protein ACI4SH_00570 [Candidatus Scatosoma sp.]